MKKKTLKNLRVDLDQFCENHGVLPDDLISKNTTKIIAAKRAYFFYRARMDGYTGTIIGDLFNRTRAQVGNIVCKYCNARGLDRPWVKADSAKDLIVDDYRMGIVDLNMLAEKHGVKRKYVREVLQRSGEELPIMRDYAPGQNVYESRGFQQRLSLSNASKERAKTRAMVMKRAGDSPGQIVHFLRREMDFRASEKWVEALS